MVKPIMFDKITENGQTALVPKPQHLDKDGKPVETGKENPLPTADSDVENRLSKIEDKLDSVIEDDKVNTQLTGSIVEEKLIDDEEIEANSSIRIVVDGLIAFKLISHFKEGNAKDLEITAFSRELNSGSRAYILSPGSDKTYGAGVGWWSDAYNAITENMKFNISNKSDEYIKLTLIIQKINDNVGNEIQDTYY